MCPFDSQEQEKQLYTVFLDLQAAYDNVQSPLNVGTVREREDACLLATRREDACLLATSHHGLYQGGGNILVDGGITSGKVVPNKGLEQGCPLSLLLYTLYTNDMGSNTMGITNFAEHPQLQLHRLHEYARYKELTVNTDKTFPKPKSSPEP
eukprot:1159830-Pelagomonas_calceolata.AAC.4